MTRTAQVRLAAAAAVAAAVLTACSGANPVEAQGDAVMNGLTTGNDAQVTSALSTANQAVAAWSVEHGTVPTAADFATIPGAASAGGATITYQAAGAGYCLTATSSGKPQVVRVLKEPGGLQPAGAHC